MIMSDYLAHHDQAAEIKSRYISEVEMLRSQSSHMPGREPTGQTAEHSLSNKQSRQVFIATS